ncbi:MULTISPECIES: hypothetical protein [Ehrlichia]|uniref:Uncharacterized protein n=1 Tax=Ehrlichia cf. muris str. EmCRT TaxID=1359167 RepID=A0A0F3ND54_9RICK|nr:MULTISPECIES: hypothetical protein [Ehrlichia]KJV65617.1 hypothetical protein EMUCRT_0562 [Ehrlichia cf. muris str. EmCRT]OUC04472.1 hypothetical protein DB91_02830 [Ehrlichia sp. Wisconsin_h]
MYTPRNRPNIFVRFMAYIFNYTTRILQWVRFSFARITYTPSTHRETKNDPHNPLTTKQQELQLEVTTQSPGNISCSSSDIEIISESDLDHLSDIEILTASEADSQSDLGGEDDYPESSVTNATLHPTQSNCRIM